MATKARYPRDDLLLGERISNSSDLHWQGTVGSRRTIVPRITLLLFCCSLLSVRVDSFFTNHVSIYSNQNTLRREDSRPSVSCAAGRWGVARQRENSFRRKFPQPQSRQEPGPWYPLLNEDTEFIQNQGVELAARLVKRRLRCKEQLPDDSGVHAKDIPPQVRGRFRDLTCEARGEKILEEIFVNYETLLILEGCEEAVEQKVLELQSDILVASVMVLQSVLVLATQVGLSGQPEQLRRLVAHLDDRIDPTLAQRDLDVWDHDSIRRLKYRIDRTPAISLLAALLYKQAPQGAFDLLVNLSVFSLHEDLALLRSGFPLRFTDEELQQAEDAVADPKVDVDAVLGIRKDLRHLKVYTIDGASTSEIDDGVSVELLDEEGRNSSRLRYWIHIADAERYVTKELWQNVARKRFTSLYLPTGTLPMFPSILSSHAMSLRAGHDTNAISMGVEINEDGSIDVESIVLTPSLIKVDYRLTYDEADEMLSEGVAYQEEWELGALFDLARKRRDFRVRNGSIEGLVRRPLPFTSVTTFKDMASADGIGISVSVDASQSSGRNQTMPDGYDRSIDDYLASGATLLVTEAMIVAGEAIGIYKAKIERSSRKSPNGGSFPNRLRLPFRTQPMPDFKSLASERRISLHLLEHNVGNGYCYAWYCRRFLQSLKISEEENLHSGLGLRSYVQWTSPIRRYSDLLTHRSIKRCMRRQRLYELLEQGQAIPTEIHDEDLGYPTGSLHGGRNCLQSLTCFDLDQDTNPLEGMGLQIAARTVQRQSQQYWLYEYLRRLQNSDPGRTFEAIVLGVTDQERRRYAVFIEELGLEHRYTSPSVSLDPGCRIRLRIDKVNPRSGMLNFVREV